MAQRNRSVQEEQADREARDALSRAQAVLSSALHPVITIDSRGVIQSASESVHRVFGHRPAELVGRNVSILMTEPHRSSHDGYLARYAQTGRTGVLGRPRVFEAQHKDGRKLMIEIAVSRVEAPGEDPSLFTAVIRDITDEKLAGDRVRLLHTLAIAIGEASDMRDAMDIATRAICEHSGWDYAETWLPRDDGRAIMCAGSTAIEGDECDELHGAAKGMCILPGGGLVGGVWTTGEAEWVEDVSESPPSRFVRASQAKALGLRACLAAPVHAGGDVVAVLVFFKRDAGAKDQNVIDFVSAALAPLSNVIRRIRAQDALRESERRFREVLNHVELAAVMLDYSGRVTFCDEYLARITGWTKDEIIGADWFERFLPPGTREEHRAIFRRAMETGEIPPRLEGEILTRDDDVRLIAWTSTIMRDEQNRIVGATGLGVDITDQRRFERDLERNRDQLQDLVQQSTRELEDSHEQLRQSDRLALIGTLAAGVGHDMNNVLLPIRCRLDALKAIDLPPEARDQFRAIRDSIAYLQQLSDGIHILAMNPESEPVLSKPTDLHAWWESVADLIRHALPDRIRFEAHIDANTPPVSVAPHRLTQALLNLVINAHEAISGEGLVRFTAEPAKGGAFVRLRVEDNGEGMTEEVRRHALDPFFTTKKRGMGTGLGLALVHAVTRAAGGIVEIDSAPGRGAALTLTLPASERPPTPHHASRPTAVVALPDPHARGLLTAMLRAADANIIATDAPGHEWDSADIIIAQWSEREATRARNRLALRSPLAVILVGDDARPVCSGVVPLRSLELEDLRCAIADALDIATGNQP